MLRLKRLIIIILIIVLIIVISSFLMSSSKVQKEEIAGLKKEYNKELSFVGNNSNSETQNMKILVIEINPIINAIYDTQYSNNGRPKVSEYLQKIGEEKTAINELIEDLRYASNGYLNITTKWEYLNEYPTYNQAIRLKNGTTSYRLDEKTYLDMLGYSSNNKGDWYNIWNSEYYSQIPSYSFDYNYIIQKFDLINRKNKGEFDQVWLCTIDPANTFETMMVGKTAYWVNGTPIQADCDNFIIANVTIARRDANLHALGHSVENIMKNAFSMKYDSYSKDSISVNSQQELESLNLWERFCLTDFNSVGNYASVGNVHFPFNAVDGYDYGNKTKVYSSWRDWLNYPNLTGEKQLDNSNAWMLYDANVNLGVNECKDPDRLYMRFWFSLFPNQLGYYKDGHFNNWWKYFYSLDYVEGVTNNDNLNKNVAVGDEIVVDCSLKYQSQKIEKVSSIREGNNVQISNKDVLAFSNNKLIAKSPGTSTVTLNYDGKSVQYIINVKESGYSVLTINHYKQKLDGTFDDTPTEIEQLRVVTGSSVTANTKTYEGFTSPTSQTVTVGLNENKIVNYQYTRNSYTLKIEGDENILSVSGSGTYKYEQEVTVNAVLKEQEGYIYQFQEWTSNDIDLPGNVRTNSISIIMPAKDVTLFAKATKYKTTVSPNNKPQSETNNNTNNNTDNNPQPVIHDSTTNNNNNTQQNTNNNNNNTQQNINNNKNNTQQNATNNKNNTQQNTNNNNKTQQNTNNKDTTTADKKMPKTGIEEKGVLIGIFLTLIVSLAFYIRYKSIRKEK